MPPRVPGCWRGRRRNPSGARGRRGCAAVLSSPGTLYGSLRPSSAPGAAARHHERMEYPELAARTRKFSYGAPRAISVAADGSRVVFLRSGGPEDPADRLHVLDVATGTERLVADPAALLAVAGDLPPEERALRERLRLSAAGIGSYAMNPAATVAAFTLGGRLFRADLLSGGVAEVGTPGPVIDPRPDPSGTRIAYVTGGTLRVTDPDGLIAGEDGITWGLAEFIADEEIDRYRG